MPRTDYIGTIDHSDLTRLLRTLRGSESVLVTEWTSTPVDSGISKATVHRLEGLAKERETTLAWSLVVKQVGKTAADDGNWQREILVYRNGLVDNLPGGLRAPRCIDSVDLSETETALWLEDVGRSWAQCWPIERYGLAAYHLGQFGGYYAVSKALPDFSWLARDKWQEDMERSDIESLKKHRDLPQVKEIYPPDITDRILALWERRLDFVKYAHHLAPLTFTHGDATGRNLYALDDETVAIDWEDAGVGPLGEEIARTLGSSLHWFFQGRMDQAPQLAETIFENYLEGLRNAGWTGDPRVVRYVYCVAAGSVFGLAYTTAVRRIIGADPERWARNNYGISATEALEHRSLMASFFLRLADEARALEKELI